MLSTARIHNSRAWNTLSLLESWATNLERGYAGGDKDVWRLGMSGGRGDWPADQTKLRNLYFDGEEIFESLINAFSTFICCADE